MRGLDVRVFLQLQSQTCFICSFTEELSTHTFYSVLLFPFSSFTVMIAPRLMKHQLHFKILSHATAGKRGWEREQLLS